MKRMFRPFAAAGLVSAATIVCASSCVDNNATMFIAGVIYPKPPGCIINNEVNNTFLGAGTLDVAFKRSYQAWLLVGNQYTPRGSKENLRAETTRVSIRGAEVRLTDSQGNELDNFSVYGSGFANPSPGLEAGYGLFLAQLIPDSIGSKITPPKEVVATVKVFGVTTGGQDIESGELSFPINVCRGCLVTFPLNALTPTGQNGALECGGSSQDTPEQGCNPGQDDLIDCRTCLASRPDVCTTPPTK